MKTANNEKAAAERANQARSADRTPLHCAMQRFSPFIPNAGSCLLTLIAGLLLFRTAFFASLMTTIIELGIDEQRAQLLAALLMTMGAALIGGFAGRRKLGATLGAGLVFGIAYVIGFMQLELQPAFDPLGNMEPLNSGALVNTVAVMLALALLCGFVGAASGIALGEVLLNPLYSFVRFLRQQHALHEHDVPSPPKHVKAGRDVVLGFLGTFAFITLLVLSSSATNLFVYAPDVGLHLPPMIRNVHDPLVPRYGTIVHDAVVSSALGGQKKAFLVYLPPSYNTAQAQTKRYPTLYLLHGSPGSASDWLTGGKAGQSADTLIALGRIPELILILPDGNGRPGQTSEWGNSFDHRQNIETYVAHDLVKYVDAKYRTLADAAHRAIGGLSMGGFGAMNIAIHHPDVFGYVISLGGYYRAEGSIWGHNVAYMHENSPIEILPTDKQAWHLQMYIGAATKDQPYYSYAKQFVQELSKLPIAYQLDIVNGAHAWGVWQVQMYHALLWLHWGS